MTSTGSTTDPLAGLLEEFLSRYRRGERPATPEYLEEFPELAARIREMLSDMGSAGQRDQVAPAFLSSAGSTSGRFSEPKQVGDYRIVRMIGRGGMGVVYEAEQLSLGRRVAIKFLPVQVSHDDKLTERFRREARAAAQLHHTNIVPVFDVGQQEELCYYAMQLIHGQSLDQVLLELRQLSPILADQHLPDEAAGTAAAVEIARSLRTGDHPSGRCESAAESTIPSDTTLLPAVGDSNGCMSSGSFELSPLHEPAQSEAQKQREGPQTSSAVLPGQAEGSTSRGGTPYYYRSVAEIGVQVADALAYAHQEGIVHRDIKPSNLLLDAHGSVWITDFGLAKVEEEGLTRTGDIIGTLRYMAPEGFRGRSDARSDVYSLGATLYEMLALRPAFDESDRLALIHQITHGCPPRLRSISPRIPADLETIVLKAIERQPEQRYQSARELEDDLQRFLDDKPIAARQSRRSEQLWRWCRRNPAVAALASAVVLLLVALTAVSTTAAFHFRQIANEREQARSLAIERGSEAERSLGTALHAVNRFFVQVSEDPRLKGVGLETLRRDLLESARTFYAELATYEGDRPDVLAEQAKAQMGLAKITRELGAPAKAIPLWHASARILERLSQEDPSTAAYRRLLAETYHELATTYGEEGQLDEASSAHHIARKLRERLVHGAPNDPDALFDLSTTLNGLGNLYLNGERFEEAAAAYSASRDFRQQITDAHPDVPKYQLGLGSVFNNLGVLHLNRKRPGDAEPLLQIAVRVHRGILDQHPDHPDYQAALALATNNLARVLRDMGRQQEAEASFRHAISLRLKLSDVHPDVPGYSMDTACSHCNLGSMYRAQGQLDDAATMYRHIVEVQDQLVQAHPDIPHYVHSLATHLDKLGNIQNDRGAFGDAEISLRRAFRMREELVQSHPENVEYARDLGGSYCNLARCLESQGDVEKSLSSYGRAVTVLSAAYARDTADPVAREYLCNSLLGRADVLYRSNRLADAARNYEQATALMEQIRRKAPNDKHVLEQLHSGWHFLGFSYAGQQQHLTAECAFRAGIDALEQLIAIREPNSDANSESNGKRDQYRRMLGERSYEVGKYLSQRGRPLYALDWFERSIEALEQIPPDSPEHNEAREQLRLAYKGTVTCHEMRGAPKKAARAREALGERIHRELRLFEGHEDRVISVAFSLDGRRALSGGGEKPQPDGSWLPGTDFSVRLWDVQTGKELQRFDGHSHAVMSVAFSPDGRRALSGSMDTTMRLWDVETGEEIRQFQGHTDSVWNVAFSPGGRRVLSTGSMDKTARVWDAETGEELQRLEGHEGRVLTAAFSPDGQRAITGGGDDDCSLRLWDLKAGEELRRFSGHRSWIWSAEFSPDGRRVMSGSADGTMRLWDLETGEQLRKYSHDAAVRRVAFGPDGSRALSASGDGTLRLWHVETGRELRRFEGHRGMVEGVAYATGGRLALSSGYDGTMRLWRLPR